MNKRIVFIVLVLLLCLPVSVCADEVDECEIYATINFEAPTGEYRTDLNAIYKALSVGTGVKSITFVNGFELEGSTYYGFAYSVSGPYLIDENGEDVWGVIGPYIDQGSCIITFNGGQVSTSKQAFVDAFTSAVSPARVVFDDFAVVLTSLQGQIILSNAIAVVAVFVGASVGLAFMWWGVRKLISAIMKAFRKGRVSV